MKDRERGREEGFQKTLIKSPSDAGGDKNMAKEVNITIENKLVLEKRDMNDSVDLVRYYNYQELKKLSVDTLNPPSDFFIFF